MHPVSGIIEDMSVSIYDVLQYWTKIDKRLYKVLTKLRKIPGSKNESL